MIFNDHISSEYQKYNTIRSSCRRGAGAALMHSFKQHRTKCHPRLLTHACFHI